MSFMVYRIADTTLMFLVILAGCCMKMNGFDRCGKFIVIVGLLKILLNALNLNWNINVNDKRKEDKDD